MDSIEHKLKITVLEAVEEYPSYLSQILDEAVAQLERSYAPYSNFNVGAAVLLENGEVHGGCNQENASYPLCICAERVALNSAWAQSDSKVVALAVVARNNQKKVLDKPISPCGACRQVILEFEEKQNQNIPIFLKGVGQKVYQVENAKSLLPFSFGKDDLI